VSLIVVDYTEKICLHFYEDINDDKKELDRNRAIQCKGSNVDDIYEVKKSLEVLSETKLKDRVFNLNPNNAIKTMRIEKMKNYKAKM
jgi:hypothetical protein